MKTKIKVKIISEEYYSGEASLSAPFYQDGFFSFLNPNVVTRQYPGSSQMQVNARKESFKLIIPFQHHLQQQ